MASTLATPSFVSGARDDLAAVDVYTQKSDSVVNNTPSVLSLPSTSTMDALRGGASAMKGLPGVTLPGSGSNGFIASLGTKTNAINIGSLTNISSSIGGGLSGLVKSVTQKGLGAVASLVSGAGAALNPTLARALNAVTPAIAQGITSKLSSKIPGLANLAGTSNLTSLISVGGSLLKIPSGNLASANSLMNAVSAINPASLGKTFNPDSLSGLASGLVSQGSKLGVSGIFTQLTPVLTTPSSLTAVMRGSLPDVISSSSLGTLKEFASVPGALPLVSTTAIGDFSSSFKNMMPMSTSDTQAQFGDIKSTFSMIEPDWNKYERMSGTTTGPNGEVIPVVDKAFDLSTTMNASPEFKSVMATGAMGSGDPADKAFLVAQAVPAPNPQAQLETLYPQAAAQPPANPAADTADPRTATQTPEDTSSGDQWRYYKSAVTGSGGGGSVSKTYYINGQGTFKIVSKTTKADGTSSSVTEYSESLSGPTQSTPVAEDPWPLEKVYEIVDREVANYPPAGAWRITGKVTDVSGDVTTVTGTIDSNLGGTKKYKTVVKSNGGYMTTWVNASQPVSPWPPVKVKVLVNDAVAALVSNSSDAEMSRTQTIDDDKSTIVTVKVGWNNNVNHTYVFSVSPQGELKNIS